MVSNGIPGDKIGFIRFSSQGFCVITKWPFYFLNIWTGYYHLNKGRFGTLTNAGPSSALWKMNGGKC